MDGSKTTVSSAYTGGLTLSSASLVPLLQWAIAGFPANPSDQVLLTLAGLVLAGGHFIYNVVSTWKPAPPKAPVVTAAAAAILMAAIFMPSLAFAAPLSKPTAAMTPRPAATVDIGKLISDAQSLLGRIQTGMDAADKLAKSNTLPEQITETQDASACYEAIGGSAKAFSDQLGTLPTDLGNDPLVLAPVIFELNRSMVKQLISGLPTPIARGCAAFAADLRMDVLKLTTTLVGVAAVKTLAAGIGIPPIPAIP